MFCYEKNLVLMRQRPKFNEQEKLKVFINMGGVDKNNYTLRIMKMLSMLDQTQTLEYLIVVGENYKHCNELNNFLVQNFENFQIFKNVNNICEIMRCSDLAVSAVGSTAWELISQGIPCLLLSIAENQKSHTGAIERSKIAEVITDLKYVDFKKKFLDIMGNVEGRMELSKQSYRAIDAKGTSRVAEIFMNDDHGHSRYSI